MNPLSAKTPLVLKAWPAPEELCLPVSRATLEQGLKNGRTLSRGQLLARYNDPYKGDLHAPLSGVITAISADYLTISVNDQAPGKGPLPLNLTLLSGAALGGALKKLGLDLPKAPHSSDQILISALEPEPTQNLSETIWLDQRSTLEAGIALAKRLWPKNRLLQVLPPHLNPLPGTDSVVFRHGYPDTLPRFLKKEILRYDDPKACGLVSCRQLYLMGSLARNGLPLTAVPMSVQKSVYLVPPGLKPADILRSVNLTPLKGDLVVLGGLILGRPTIRLEQGLGSDVEAIHLIRNRHLGPGPGPCRRCRLCHHACPLKLPVDLVAQAPLNQWAHLMESTSILDTCSGCGLCALACPSQRPLGALKHLIPES